MKTGNNDEEEEKDQDVHDICFDSHEIDQIEVLEEIQVEKKLRKSNRVKWTAKEFEEIQQYFEKHLKVKATPGKSECLKVIKKCKEEGGQICRRDYHTIVKKISNMNKK